VTAAAMLQCNGHGECKMQTFLDTSLNSFACDAGKTKENARKFTGKKRGNAHGHSSAKMSPHAIKNVAKITQQTERCSNEACAGLCSEMCVL